MSYKTAVTNKCKECIYDPAANGTWVQQVRECTSISCPLFPYRPGIERNTGRKMSEEHKRKLKLARKGK